MAEDWSTSEVNIIVAGYFQMLIEEIKGSAYNKAEHRRSILPFLKNRSEQSVEFKHRNISAILAKTGVPYINGYKPAWNYQKLLEEAVMEFLGNNHQIEKSFALFAEASPPINTGTLSFENLIATGTSAVGPGAGNSLSESYKSELPRSGTSEQVDGKFR